MIVARQDLLREEAPVVNQIPKKGQKEVLVMGLQVKRKALNPEVRHIPADRLRMKDRKEALVLNRQAKRKALRQGIHLTQADLLRMKDRKEALVLNRQAKRKALNHEAHHIQEGQHLMNSLREVLAVKDQRIKKPVDPQNRADLENAVIARITSRSANLKTHLIASQKLNAARMRNHYGAGKNPQQKMPD
jgi:hypothetical protein